jgi:hypothetical protein
MMKNRIKVAALTLLLSVAGLSAVAATTITTTNRYAYAANLGWVDWRGDTNNGAVIGEYVCSGYIYSANVGWINLGNGSPANGIRYQNNSASDFGVNQDGSGNLSGMAYAANIGWVVFTNASAGGSLAMADRPQVDLLTGKLSGYAYSANCGWVSLSNAFAYVQTSSIQKGADTDGDGIADAWELTYTNTLAAFNASSDADHDGMSDYDEYIAGTSPTDSNDNLRITSVTHGISTPTYTTLIWTAKPTRFYAIQNRSTLDATNAWADFVVFPYFGANNAGFDQYDDQMFYRILAFRPLTP